MNIPHVLEAVLRQGWKTYGATWEGFRLQWPDEVPDVRVRALFDGLARLGEPDFMVRHSRKISRLPAVVLEWGQESADTTPIGHLVAHNKDWAPQWDTNPFAPGLGAHCQAQVKLTVFAGHVEHVGAIWNICRSILWLAAEDLDRDLGLGGCEYDSSPPLDEFDLLAAEANGGIGRSQMWSFSYTAFARPANLSQEAARKPWLLVTANLNTSLEDGQFVLDDDGYQGGTQTQPPLGATLEEL